MFFEFKIYNNGEHVDTVNRKMYKEYWNNRPATVHKRKHSSNLST